MRVSGKFIVKKLLPLRAERDRKAALEADARRDRVLEQIYNQDVADTEAACASLRRYSKEQLAEKYRGYSV